MSIRTSEQLKELFQKTKEKKLQEREKQKIALEEYKQLYQKLYREKHREEIKQKAKIYREKNREFIRAYDKARHHKQPLPNKDDFETILPPVTSKKQVKEIYNNWLQQLRGREQYLTGEKLKYNQLMQESIMGRNKLTYQEVKEKYNSTVEILHKLIEKRKSLPKDDPDRNTITKQISTQNAKLSKYKEIYNPEKPIPNINKSEFSTNAKTKLQAIEQKALQLMAQTTDENQIKIIKEQLEYTKLRAKYSFC